MKSRQLLALLQRQGERITAIAQRLHTSSSRLSHHSDAEASPQESEAKELLARLRHTVLGAPEPPSEGTTDPR